MALSVLVGACSAPPEAEAQARTTSTFLISARETLDPAPTPATTVGPSSTVAPTSSLPATTRAPAPDPGSESASNRDAVAGEDPASGEKAGVTLLDPGAEPRRPLRYDFADGLTETMVTTFDQEITVTFGGGIAETVSVGGVEIEILETVTRIGDQYRLESEIRDVRLTGDTTAAARAVAAEMSRLIGTKTVVVHDDRGRVTELELGEGMSGSVLSELGSAGQMAALLPAEPVGVGAVWESVQQLDIRGAPIEQTTRFELLSVAGPVVEIASTVNQSAASGSVLEVAGLEGTIERWEGTGRGSLTIDLTSLVPRASLTMVSDQAFSVSVDDVTASVGVTIDLSIHIAPSQSGG